MTFEVRPVTDAEVALFSDVLTRVSKHLRATDRPMWPPEHCTPEALARFFTTDELRLGWWDGEPVATLVLQREDPWVWPEARPGEALYVHRLSVAPGFTGRGLAARLLDHAVRETRGAGRPFLRLDTGADRPKLRALYEGYGFRFVEEKPRTHYVAAKYELALGAGDAGAPTDLAARDV